MARPGKKSVTEKIFENILFLEEVFGGRADSEIPKLPVLEMAQCFDLNLPRVRRARRHRNRCWSLWK